MGSPHRPDKRRCTCGSSGYQEILQGHCESSLPTFPGARGAAGGAGRAAEGGHRLRAQQDRRADAHTWLSQHQLKAVKVNEGGRGAWHRSTQAHKGGFLKSRERSNLRTPAGAFRRGALTSIRLRGRGFPWRRLEPGRGRRWPGESLRPGRPAPSRSSASRPAAVCAQLPRSDLRGEHSADRARPTPPRLPQPVKSGSARPPASPLSGSPPAPAARRACPVPLRAGSERARASAPCGQERTPLSGSCLQPSPGVSGRPPAFGGKQAGGTRWAGDGPEQRRQGTAPSYQGCDQSRTKVAGSLQVFQKCPSRTD